MKIQITKVPNKMADGGWLSHTHGSDFDSGLDFVAEGRSHEQNPYGGVMVGQDESGVPNLVEEGEFIWNGDYVFSKRMKVPKKLAKKYGLGGDMTFADAIAKLTKDSEERPLSNIDCATNDHILGEFADSQEELRMAKAQRAMDKEIQLQDDFLTGFQFGLGGHMSPLGIVPDADNISPFEKAEKLFADGGGIHIDPSKKGTFKAQASKMGMGVQEAASHILANKENYSPAMVKKANFARNASHWHGDGGDLFSNPFAYGGELGNVFEGKGNRPNTLNLDAANQSLVRRIFGDTGFTRFMENTSAALNDPLGYFAGNEIDTIVNKIASMTEPEMEKFFSTPLGQSVASAIVKLDGIKGSDAQEAGVQRWLKSTGRLARPIMRSAVNASKRALAQSKLTARGQMKTPKGSGKPTTLNETMTQIEAAQNNLPVVRRNQALTVQGPRSVATINRGASGVGTIGSGSTGVVPSVGNAGVGLPVQRWDATLPFWGGVGLAAGNLLNAEGEPEVDAVTGETILTQQPSSTRGSVVGTGTSKSNRFADEIPVTSNRAKKKGVEKAKPTEIVEPVATTRSLTDTEFAEEYPMIARPTEEVQTNPWTDGSIWQQEAAQVAGVKPQTSTSQTSKFTPKQTWTRNVPWMMSGAMALKEMLTPADYSNADAILDAAYRVGQPVSIGTEYVGDYRKRDPFDERYLMNIINQNKAATNRNMMNLSGGNRAVGMSGILANDLTSQMALADAARQAYLANRADDAQVSDFNYRTNKGNADAQNTRNRFLAGLNSQRQQAMLSGISQGARLRQAIKDQRDAAIYGNLSNFAQGLGDIGWENSQYNMIGGLADEDVLKYIFDKDFMTTYKNRLNKNNIGEG